MPDLSPELLARTGPALRRGEFVHPDDTLLCLPVVVEPAADLSSTLPNYTWSHPDQLLITGALVLSPDAAYREAAGRWERQELSASAGVRVELHGPTHYPYHRTSYEPEWQLANRIRVGSWPMLGVWLRLLHEQERLIRLLQTWYERRVPVQELYQHQRTFLLDPDMSYEEIQAFKRRYGVTLY
ncbi:hypothetical protein [Hymenobacter sp. CRA2]|uniref:hypothetical protein n=1 Tax=Hymenobacter sp. CRA2 TaxID=1955620 RepID=UPI0009CF5595|nr:hypothetical protein [Hymenobacter sp. CRA2]OON70990.1 hypothetical protein B0919_03055 [Hymenobacter sp. CRA2]